MVIKKENEDREIRLIAGRDRLKESTQEITRSFLKICENKTKFYQLIDDLIIKTKMDKFYSSQKEQIKKLYKIERNSIGEDNLDDFFDYFFDNYNLLYKKLKSPIRKTIKYIVYDNVQIERISVDFSEEEYMNSMGETFKEKFSEIEIKVDGFKLEFTDSFSKNIPENLLSKFALYLKQEIECYSTEILVKSNLICDEDGELLDEVLISKKIKNQVVNTLFGEIDFEIDGMITLLEMNFYPILINYQFEKGNFVFDFIDQQKIKPDPNSNREFYNKVNCGSILLDDEMKFSFIDVLSNNETGYKSLFDMFKSQVDETIKKLTLGDEILSLKDVLEGDIPIFILPDQNIRNDFNNFSLNNFKSIKKIAMSIDPNQWNRVWNVIGESL